MKYLLIIKPTGECIKSEYEDSVAVESVLQQSFTKDRLSLEIPRHKFNDLLIACKLCKKGDTDPLNLKASYVIGCGANSAKHTVVGDAYLFNVENGQLDFFTDDQYNLIESALGQINESFKKYEESVKLNETYHKTSEE